MSELKASQRSQYKHTEEGRGGDEAGRVAKGYMSHARAVQTRFRRLTG